jgi:pimeloyl-ACP methyl ester carboxylesterase
MHSIERVAVVTLPDGRALRARLWDGDGPPLVLLHGALSSAATWRPLVRATSRRCIALDLPGFGASSPTSAPRLECFADDVIAALRALGVARCTVVGHSFGGAVAVAVAARSEHGRAGQRARDGRPARYGRLRGALRRPGNGRLG